MIECQNGSSLRAIARRLNRSVSTVSREVRRLPRYDAKLAAGLYPQRRRVEGTARYRYVYALRVHLRGSPEQIATKLRAVPNAIRPGLVSYETIYTAIYATSVQGRGPVRRDPEPAQLRRPPAQRPTA